MQTVEKKEKKPRKAKTQDPPSKKCKTLKEAKTHQDKPSEPLHQACETETETKPCQDKLKYKRRACEQVRTERKRKRKTPDLAVEISPKRKTVFNLSSEVSIFSYYKI